jgi:CubicO group peptidase (beta-lactamase class C family)
MKKYIIPIALVVLFTHSCKTEISKEEYLSQISEIENGLLPVIILDGEEQENFNIYKRMLYYKVPGVSIAFMDNGEIIWAKGYGYTSFDSIAPIDQNTIFQAASISKPVAAMAALHLVEEGMLDLDKNVNEYLSGWQVDENEFTANEKVTLRGLLSHSAGLTVHGFGGYSATDSVPGTIQILNGNSPANSGRIYPDVTPRSIYRYSGGGYTVMQKMLGDVTGKSFPDIMKEYVLGPIGMESSAYSQPLSEGMSINAAMAHNSDGSMIEGRWHTYPEMAAAGLWTNPTDLLKYALEVQNSVQNKSNKILSKKMTIEMLTPQMESHGLGPGLGGRNSSATFSHGGSNAGYRCYFQAFSHGGQGVAIMTNSDNGDALMGEILRSFSSIYSWDNYKPLRKKLVDLEENILDELAGDYLMKVEENELLVHIEVNDKHLTGTQDWDNFTFDMLPESESLFFNKNDQASFKFIRNMDGEVTEIIIQGQWHFKRLDSKDSE